MKKFKVFAIVTCLSIGHLVSADGYELGATTDPKTWMQTLREYASPQEWRDWYYNEGKYAPNVQDNGFDSEELETVEPEEVDMPVRLTPYEEAGLELLAETEVLVQKAATTGPDVFRYAKGIHNAVQNADMQNALQICSDAIDFIDGQERIQSYYSEWRAIFVDLLQDLADYVNATA